MATLTLQSSITGVVPHKRCVKKLFFHNSARKKYFPQYQSRCSVIERAAPVYQGAGERGGERKGEPSTEWGGSSSGLDSEATEASPGNLGPAPTSGRLSGARPSPSSARDPPSLWGGGGGGATSCNRGAGDSFTGGGGARTRLTGDGGGLLGRGLGLARGGGASWRGDGALLRCGPRMDSTPKLSFCLMAVLAKELAKVPAKVPDPGSPQPSLAQSSGLCLVSILTRQTACTTSVKTIRILCI